MATITSHVLDAVAGCSAAGVRVECIRVSTTGERKAVFDVNTDHEGRINETVQLTAADASAQFELVFHSAAYFDGRTGYKSPIMPCVVLRIAMPDAAARYHLPVIAGPHSYSTWWSA